MNVNHVVSAQSNICIWACSSLDVLIFQVHAATVNVPSGVPGSDCAHPETHHALNHILNKSFKDWLVEFPINVFKSTISVLTTNLPLVSAATILTLPSPVLSVSTLISL